METIASRALDVIRRFLRAYLEERSIPDIRRCVTDDVRWIGTGAFERAGEGFRPYVDLLNEEFESDSEGYGLTLRDMRAVPLGEKACYVEGDFWVDRCLPGGGIQRVAPRFSAVCVEEDGVCRIKGMHASLPSGAQSEGEFFPTMLFGEQGQAAAGSWRSAFDLLRNSLPGGLIGGYVEEGFPLYFINDQLLEYLGYTYEEFVKETKGMVENGIHPDDRAAVARAVAASFRRSDRYEITYRMLKKGGSFIWVLDRGCRIVTDEGRDAIVSIVIDMTESHALEERLKRSVADLESKNRELKTFYRTVFNGFAKLADDDGYTILYANDQYFQLCGYSRAEVRDLFGNRASRLVHPDDLRGAAAQIRAAEGRFSLKIRFLTKEGGSVWMRMDASRSGETWNGRNVIYCFYTNIDEEERRNAEYLRQQYFMALISSSIAGGSFVTRAEEGRPLVYVSDSLLAFLGYSRDAFAERAQEDGLTALVHPEDREMVRRACRNTDPYYEWEYRLRKADGTVIWALEKGRLSADEEGRPVYICILLDITERRLRQQELIRQTRLDPLTGLYNREYAQQYVNTYLDIHRDAHSSAMLVFDLDHFKRINDRYGHLKGDAVLTGFAQLLSGCFRSRDFVARIGGDEFLAFMQDVPDRAGAVEMADRVCAAMKKGMGARYADCDLAVSVGIAYSREKGLDYDALFQAADDDMYRVKFRGRGRDMDIAVHAEAEREFLFRNSFGLILRIDLETGRYTVPYGAYLANADVPVRGFYDETMSRCFASYVYEEDREVLRGMNLDALRREWEEGREFSLEYRVRRLKGEVGWVCSRFLFVRAGGERLCYLTVSDVTEKRDHLERSRIAALYDFTLRDAPGEIYEINFTRGRFRALRRNPLFLPLPDEGGLDFLRAAVRDMLHPDDLERYEAFLERACACSSSDSLCEEYRCRWLDGDYHWVSFNVLTVDDPEKVQLVCVMGIDERKRLDDVSRENTLLRRLHVADERYRIIVEETHSVIFDCDLVRDEHYAPYLKTFLACNVESGRVPDMLRSLQVHPEDRDVYEAFEGVLLRDGRGERTLRFKRRDGAYIWCRMTVTLRRGPDGTIRRVTGTISDVDENVRALERLRYQAEHDPLTGYSTFAKFKEDAARILKERGDRPCSLWYCDIRNFKFINDIYGYDTGDALLNHWAAGLADRARPGETFARISGDNFVLLRDYQGREDLVRRFLRGADLLSRFEGLANHRFRVDMIAGIYLVEKPEDLLSIDDMLDRANIAQKSVKHLSGSKYAIYSEEMRKRVLYEKAIEGCMDEALRRREFCVYLQPQIDIQHGNGLFGAEVLVRWNRPGHGMVSPGDFIPLFERNGFIVALDAFVFEEACAYIASRRRRGLPPVRLSVNISRVTLAQGDFLDRYSQTRERYGVADGLLELECTETVVIRNYELFREIMASLPARGFRSAMDDFGTGYSSLNMLKEIVLDVLKLDIGFFRDTEGTSRERAVVESIVCMARALGMATVAEGVERREQVDFLRAVGCDAVQGYYFSRPVPLSEFETVESAFG